MWLSHHTTPHCISLDYDQLLLFYDVRPLRARRDQFDVLFLHKLFKGLISSSYLLKCFTLHVPPRLTRNAPMTLFNVPFGRVSTVKSGFFVRLPRKANEFLAFSPHSDLLTDSIGRIKKQLKLYTAAARG